MDEFKQENSQQQQEAAPQDTAPQPQYTAPQQNAAPQTGSSDNVLAGLGILIPIVGFIMYFVKKDDAFLLFYSKQAFISFITLIVASIASAILGIIPVVGGVLGVIINILTFVIWIFDLIAAINAFQRKEFKIPVIGDAAEKL